MVPIFDASDALATLDAQEAARARQASGAAAGINAAKAAQALATYKKIITARTTGNY